MFNSAAVLCKVHMRGRHHERGTVSATLASGLDRLVILRTEAPRDILKTRLAVGGGL